MELKPYGNTIEKKAIIPLKELLPLAMPFSMLIDPTNSCNFQCTFCPTGDDELLTQVGRPKGFMQYELFVKIIDDLCLMCKQQDSQLKHLHLYKDGEPLLNKFLGKMITYAKKQSISKSVETTTNGAALTEKRAIELIESGLDRIRISVEHTTDAGYKEITKTFNNYQKIRDNIEFLYHEKERKGSHLKIHAKIVDSGLSDEEREKFITDFSPISDSLNIDQLMGWSKSEVVDWKLGQEVTTGMSGVSQLKEWKTCPEPFSKLAVNFDGTVSICCVDWSHGTIVGNLVTQSLSDVWHGDKLRNFRLKHLKGERKQIDVCSNCDYMKGFSEHTQLDNDADRLIQLYSIT